VTLDERAVQDLLDRQAVIDACYRYAEAVDRTARELSDDAFEHYATTMTDDCVVDYGPLGCFTSRDEWLAFARGLAARSGLCHHMYANFFVEVDGDVATARFHAQALHFFADQPPPAQLLIGAGIFEDRLRRTPDGWKLSQVQPNVQFLWDPGGAAARMFPAPGAAQPEPA
jgi:hypothetical protein